MATHQVRALLMGGQACVFYGAAEFSRDTDLAILADAANWQRLTSALAELQAEIYRVPVDRVMEHARLRAEAMTIRDTKAEAGSVKEEDWAKINELLRQSWRSLARAVKS